MGYQQDRDQTLIELGRAGFTTRQARQLLALGTTLQRLAEGQCNGDYPWDNGERKVQPCGRCESLCAPSQLRGRTYPLVYALLSTQGTAIAETALTDMEYTPAARTHQERNAPDDVMKPYRWANVTQNAAINPPICPDCRAQDRVRAVLAEGPRLRDTSHCTRCGLSQRGIDAGFDPAALQMLHGGGCGGAWVPQPAWIPYFQGDPRGCVLYIYPAGTPDAAIQDGSARSQGIAIVGRY